MKKIYNVLAVLVVVLMGLSLAACSKDEYDTNPYSKGGVNLLAFGPSPNTRSQEIRITGTNLTAVDKVIFAGGTLERAGKIINVTGAEVEKANFNSVDNENILVNIPDESVPGKIKLVSGRDTITSVGVLTFQEPITVASISPLAGLSAGDEISIKGDYVYNVAEVIFTSGISGAAVEAEDFTYVSRKEIRLRVPLAAESGVITLTDGDEWEFVYEEPAEIVGATIADITPLADFGQQIQITGSNLHIVESVLFPGGVSAEFTVSDDHKTITATVPAECKSGALSLLLYSGAAISTPEFNVPEVEITSAEPNKDLIEGDVVTITGENFNRVVGVSLPGIGDILDYEISGNTLTFTVPEGMTDGDVVLTQNAYISKSVSVEMRKMEGVIWMGNEPLSGWSNWGVFNWSGDMWTKFQQAITGAGQLTFHFEPTTDAPIFNLRMGDWSTAFSDISIPYGEGGNIRPEEGVTDIVINLTAEEREAMFADGGKGIVMWGDGLVLKYVKFIAAGAERTMWEGSEDLTDGHQPYIGTDGGAEFKDLDVTAGNVVRFYIEPVGDDWWFEVFEGHWGPWYGKWTGENSDLTPGTTGPVALTLTQAMIDAALTQGWWGGIFVVQGKVKLTKVTVAPL